MLLCIDFLCFLFSVDAWTVTFSPDSKYIATGSHAGKINLFSVDSGKLESSLETKKFTLSIAFVSISYGMLFHFCLVKTVLVMLSIFS